MEFIIGLGLGLAIGAFVGIAMTESAIREHALKLISNRLSKQEQEQLGALLKKLTAKL